MIDTRQLRHFVAVVEAGGFRQAARTANMSPPALFRSVRMLEDHFGVRLLDRSGRGVRPTAHGRRLLQDAHALIAGHEAIPRNLQQLSDLGAGELSVGVSPVVVDACLDRVLAGLLRRHPNVAIRIEIDPVDALIKALAAHRVDLIVAYQTPQEHHGGIEVTPLYEDQTVWCVRKGHPLTRAERPGRDVLADYPIITQALPLPFQEWLDNVLLAVRRDRSASAQLRQSVQCTDYPLILRTLLASDAIGFGPTQNILAAPQAESLRILDLPMPMPGFGMAAGHLRKFTPSPLARAFVEEMQAVVRKWVRSRDGEPVASHG